MLVFLPLPRGTLPRGSLGEFMSLLSALMVIPSIISGSSSISSVESRGMVSRHSIREVVFSHRVTSSSSLPERVSLLVLNYAMY